MPTYIPCPEKDFVSVTNRREFQGFRPHRFTARSQPFNLDNGAGTTIDDVILRASKAITVVAARIVYSDATSGTVAAGNVKVGITVGGSEIVSVTAYENAKAVGTSTTLVVATGDPNFLAVAANVPVIVRHTGVAATQAGFAYVEIEYYFDDLNVPLFRAPSKGAILDFVRMRYATAGNPAATATIRKVASATAADVNGTAVSSAKAIDATGGTNYDFTLLTTGATFIAGDSLVYVNFSAAPGLLENVVFEYGFHSPQ